MNHELRPPVTVEEWIKERHANCLRIAKTKPEGYDKAGWLEDADYFQAVMDRLQAPPKAEATSAELVRATEDDGSQWVNADAFDNLSMMIRRMIWMAEKETGDTSLKTLAGQARQLLISYGQDGSPLRDPRDPDHSRSGIFVHHNCWKCNSGKKPCVRGNPNQCDYPQARND